jgi:hypothetical protein
LFICAVGRLGDLPAEDAGEDEGGDDGGVGLEIESWCVGAEPGQVTFSSRTTEDCENLSRPLAGGIEAASRVGNWRLT